jgi:hypothetical protein
VAAGESSGDQPSHSAGGVGFNLYNNSVCGADQEYELANSSGCGAGDLIDFEITPLAVQAVPEPATLTLLGFGLAASRLARRRARRVEHWRSFAA